MVKKIAEKFNRLSRVHQRHRQTDRQQTTDRQTTDGRLIAYSERNVVRSLKTTRHEFVINNMAVVSECKLASCKGHARGTYCAVYP